MNHREAQSLVARKTQRLEDAERIVAPILEDVRSGAMPRCSLTPASSTASKARASASRSHGSLEPEFGRAVRDRRRQHPRIRAACSSRSKKLVEYPDGRKLGQIVRPLDSMGAYTPAGRYPLPSTLLMNMIPAQVAGVKTTCVACPHPAQRFSGIAAWLGVTHFFQMGGAQAIAALAFGTATVPRVDRIVGPGNIYVAAAKKLIAGETGIDFVAGPTEIVIIAAEGNPRVDRRRHAGASRARCGRFVRFCSRPRATWQTPWPRTWSGSSLPCRPPPSRAGRSTTTARS